MPPRTALACAGTRRQVDAGLDALQLHLPGPVRDRLAAYLELLARWNCVYNLTAVRTIAEMVPKHLLDCLVLLPHLCGTRLLDVGSGPGLPGMILAIARPDVHCVLLDSNGKKTRFCLHAAAALGLQNVEVVHTRIERYRPQGRFTTLTTRAWASLDRVLAQAARLCIAGGRVLIMKGRYPRDELEALGPMGDNVEVLALEVPGLDARRHLVVVTCGGGTGSPRSLSDSG